MLRQTLNPRPLSTISDPPRKHHVALQMIQYALSHARGDKSRSFQSHDEAIRVLEQGVEGLRLGKGEKDGVGMILLAMATLMHQRGDFDGAVEKLKMARELDGASLGVQVAALEGLVGLNLEAGQDATSSITANECLQLLKSRHEEGTSAADVLTLRSKTLKGLVDIVLGDLKSAALNFEGLEKYESDGNFLLSFGEFHHLAGNSTLAKDIYEKAQIISEGKADSESYFMSAANMVPEEATLGATCALGQLLAHSGKFQESEEWLTKALTRAEEYYGVNHPKVGMVLTCMATMFGQKAKLERSSSLLIQEGLYRRAIDLLKAPALDSEGSDIQVDKRDVVALARGGYGEILCVQQNRKSEGEQMKKWAESAWRNHRLSLAEVLEFAEPSKAVIVDTRICRVL